MSRTDDTGDRKQYSVETIDGILTPEIPDMLNRFLDESEENESKQSEFLSAWKDGVEVAGEQFFVIRCEVVASANDKDDLRPDLEMIKNSIGVISPGERVFILSLCQFFNARDIQELCSEFDIEFPTLTDISHMDKRRRQVITKLIEAFTGW